MQNNNLNFVGEFDGYYIVLAIKWRSDRIYSDYLYNVLGKFM